MIHKLRKELYTGLMLAGVLLSFSSHAQNGSPVAKLPLFSTEKTHGSFNADLSSYHLNLSFAGKMNEWFGTDENHTFILEREYTDELNMTHAIYQHYYKGIKVADEQVTLHEKNGVLIYINGELTEDINVVPGNLLAANAIIDAAATELGTLEIKINSAENVIAKITGKGGTVMHSVTKAEVISARPVRSYIFYIDNATGAVIKKSSKVFHADTPSVSATLFQGNQSVTVDSYSGGYRLKDNARKIHTLNGTDLDGGVDFSTGELTGATEYYNANANFTSNVHKPAVQVHWGMAKTYDYYKNRHNRNSYDNAGAAIRNYYNIDLSMMMDVPEGYGFNAAALDAGNIVAMVYGNGNIPGMSNAAHPVVALDVAGHEFSHLVINRNGRGGLNYEGESGAINEAIADMMGTAIEFYTGITPNWLIGENVMRNTPRFMRSMSNPNGPASFGRQQPDTYSGYFWADPNDTEDGDQGGVHTNSGVGNHWFYLLSAGGSGTNDNFDAYSVTGIGIEKAEKIIYRALTTYFTANTNYHNAFTYTKQAIADLYGANSAEAVQNAKAWFAVGIGNGTLSTADFSLAENSVSVYPNPVTGGVAMLNLGIDRDAAYELYDITGKLIVSAKKLSFGNNAINVNGVQAGVYLLKVNVDGSSVTKKLIIK